MNTVQVDPYLALAALARLDPEELRRIHVVDDRQPFFFPGNNANG